jgi:hypothetical protein
MLISEEQYKKIIEGFPRSKRHEVALSILVHLCLENGQEQTVMEVYQRLSSHPGRVEGGSSLLPDHGSPQR